jgi:hypothetical protein
MTVVVAINLPKPAGKVLALARLIIERMEGNPLFPTPNPPLATVQADIDALATAEAFVLTRTKGAREARDAKLADLHRDLKQLASYVQSIADTNPPSAEAIVESSGFTVKRPSIRTKAAFKVLRGPLPGTVKLLAKWAGDRAVYGWRYSLDETTWTSLPDTWQSSTTLSGLAPLTRYFFQVRVMTKDGQGDWGDSLSLSLS